MKLYPSPTAALTPARARTVIDAWADRTAELGALPEVEQVFCFENRGQQIGVTLNHPHGQIYAYPYLPPVAERELYETYVDRIYRLAFRLAGDDELPIGGQGDCQVKPQNAGGY